MTHDVVMFINGLAVGFILFFAWDNWRTTRLMSEEFFCE